MKKKYSLMIADMQLSVIADAEPEEVEKIVGILDRKMREINLKSRCCSKNEAALLCALEFCSDRLTLQEQNAELEAQNEKYAAVLSAFKEQVAALQDEQERLRNENAVLRSVITQTPAQAQTPAEAEETPARSVSPTEFLAEVAEAQTESTDASAEPDATAETPSESRAAEAPAPSPEAAPRKNRSRVGSMFDLLSFNEV